MKAYFGEHATAENDFLFESLPRIDDDNSAYFTVEQMLKGNVKGYIIAGENPAVGHANGKAHRLGLSKLDWLVVRDVVEIESASFWYDSPEVESGELTPEECATEIFFLPAASHTEKDGSFTNTQRLLQWHWQAVEPKEDCRSELWFYFHLGRLIKQKLADSEEERDRLVKALRWEYPTHSQIQEPSAEAVLQEVSGWKVGSGEFLSGYPELKDDGSTLVRLLDLLGLLQGRDQPDGAQEAALGAGELRRARVGLGVAGRPAAALQPRLRRPGRQAVVGAQALRLVGRRRGAVDRPRRAGLQATTKDPHYVPPEGAKAEDAIAGDHPFIMQADGRAWLYVPQGLEDGPLPTHYEPHESPFGNPLYSQRANPRRQQNEDLPEDPYNPVDGEPGAEVYPYVVTTYRADRAPHRRRDDALDPVPLRAAAGDVLRGAPRARARRSGSSTAAGRRSTRRARRSRRACSSPTASRPVRMDGRAVAPDRAALPLGQARARHRRLGQRPRAHGARPERPHPGGQGVHLRDPAGPPPARRRAAALRRRAARAGAVAARRRPAGRARGDEEDDAVSSLLEPTGAPAGWETYGDERKERVGFFTDTSVCIGCKACEVACKEWNLIPEDGLVLVGRVVRQHLAARRELVAPRRVRRAAQAAAGPRSACGGELAGIEAATPARTDDARCAG